MSAISEGLADEAVLEITDISVIPAEPPAELFYTHRRSILASAREAWRRRDVMVTLAERDIRAAYKQQILGLGWVFIMPMFTLVIFTVLLHNVKSFQMNGVPYAVATYVGLWGWGFFSGALGGATGSLIQNKVMMAKTHFPRECFPLSQVLESAFTSALATFPLLVLFAIYTYPPRLTALWIPLYLAIEVPFIVGVVLFTSSVVVQARDLMQLMGVLTQFGMLATPVIWPFYKHVHGIWRPIYSFVNPLAPVIQGLKESILLGQGPSWGLLGLALAGGCTYLAVGYTVFKTLEVNFADLT